MSASQSAFAEPPRSLTREAFLARFAGLYEDSPWVAERLWDQGLTEAHDSIAGLHAALASIVATAGDDEKLALIRAHPDLAGKAAAAGIMTEDSKAEQAGAGLDRCSPAELQRFQTLNAAYKAKFGFPYILAVRGRGRREILADFSARLDNDAIAEFAEALRQIDQIALLRLEALEALP